MEPEDDGPVDTALRESEEEIGLQRDAVNVIGALATYVTRTGFVVTPVIGFVRQPFVPRPDPEEVAEVFEVPLDFLMDPVNHNKCSKKFDGVTRHFFAIPYDRYYIWGATAGMIMNLYEVVSKR
jgi:8-oxo-dGTP pyrophosphatase MutT (NUDIX family)